MPLHAIGVAACATVGVAPRDGAPAESMPSGALDAQRAWWRALAVGDTALLEARTARPLALTLSSGRTLDRAAAIAQAVPYATMPQPTIEWSDETVRLVAPGVAVASTRAIERVAAGASTYRYTTVLQRDGAGWRVTAGHSTREAAPTPRLPADASGALADYVGDYRGPRGGIVRIVARDSVLALVEPSGRALRMAPIGPALFELDEPTATGTFMRVAFARDAGGRVTAASRLIPGGINTFVRVP